MTSGLLIVIPCLNEEAHLPGLLALLCAEPAAAGARIVVADGGSTDASAEIVRAASAKDARITLLSNPKRIQSAAVNLAVARYSVDAETLIRVDAHARYPTDFLTRLIDAANETGADTVTISMRAASEQEECFQTAAAAAQNSVLGAGGSPHRKGGERRWVDHGHHALFKLATYRAAGGYDETFTHNEDAELDARIRARGGKILLAADILIDYFPRKTAGALARQYFGYGRGRARTVTKHKETLKLRQLAPLAVAPVIMLAALAPLSLWAGGPALLWLALCLGYGILLGIRERRFCAAFAGIPAAIMHATWSAGFLTEILAPTRATPAPTETQSA
jgi:succinoglycan biosynthesis protein ExoA